MSRGLLFTVALFAAMPALAGPADVMMAKAKYQDDGTFTFEVTVRHNDQGWDHWADKWQVQAPDGTVIGERVLLHPHDKEQPFTRFLEGVAIPDGIERATVRAHDNVHGFGGAEAEVELCFSTRARDCRKK